MHCHWFRSESFWLPEWMRMRIEDEVPLHIVCTYVCWWTVVDGGAFALEL